MSTLGDSPIIDHVFATCSILGYRFAPRIRDLPHKRLYAFDPEAALESL